VWTYADDIPEKGKIYTIRFRRLDESSAIPERHGWACTLVEIINPTITKLNQEVESMEWRFRSLCLEEEFENNSEAENANELLISNC